jgi:hypothetical protein
MYGYVQDTNTRVDRLGLLPRVFWSGGREAREAAENFVKVNGGETLEMTPQGKSLENWTKGMDWETEAEPLWRKTSADFAGGTTGTAHVFIYEPNYRGADSVWESLEKSILEKKRVNIVEHRITASCH